MPGKSIPVRILIASTHSLAGDSHAGTAGEGALERKTCFRSLRIAMHAGFLVSQSRHKLDAPQSTTVPVEPMGEQ